MKQVLLLSLLLPGFLLLPGGCYLPIVQSEELPDATADSGLRTELSGYFWVQQIGLISLSCENTLDCDVAEYGVARSPDGQLSGAGWNADVGWIDFSPNKGGGVSIDESGNLYGLAWNEDLGWLQFDGISIELVGSAVWVPHSVGAAEVMEGVQLIKVYDEAPGAGQCFLQTVRLDRIRFSD